METELLKSLATKLGVKEDKITRKAEEFMRLVDIRSGCSSLTALSLSGSCKAVMCLDLAASTSGQPVEKTTAIQTSGMNKKMYTGGLKAMECLLDLHSSTTIPELTVQFGCTAAKTMALQILSSYEKQHNNDSADYSRALFNTAALYTACRKQKIKVDKKRLLDTAGVRRSIFDLLVSQMETHAKALFKDDAKHSGKRGKSYSEELENMLEIEPSSKQPRSNGAGEDATEEPYEEWKRRILESAYTALGKTYVPSS